MNKLLLRSAQRIAVFILLGMTVFSSSAQTAPPFAFKTNDIVVLTGESNIERTRFNGLLQTQIIATDPSLHLRFRNLAWEGDTVFEQWRDNGKEQWRRPRDWQQQLTEVSATVVFAQFGQMESLKGKANLDAFITAYDKLLDQFVAPERRIILVSPMPFEKTAIDTLPDLSTHNGDVQLYVQAIRDLAVRKGLRFVDVFNPLPKFPTGRKTLTDNGYQLNAHGHAVIADLIVRQLGLTPQGLFARDQVLAAVIEMERLWFNYWRPMNWSFLAGDRTSVPFSRDWRDQSVRLFPEEMKEYIPLLQQADENIWLAVAGKPLVSFSTPPDVAPVLPPSAPPQSAEEELATFKIDPHYEVSLYASEKDGIEKPVRMQWDERGRLWVACTVSYPQIKPGEKANDRIVICEDTKGTGRADKFTTFVDGLFMPTGLEFGDGGLYVCQGTELMHFKDTDGDGHADQKRIVLGGFGTADSHQMINSITWGFGGELWLTQGHHIYSRVETPRGVEHLNRAGVWRLRPRTLQLDPFFQMSSAGQNDWGVVTDDYGQVFHKSGATIGGYYSVPGLIHSDLDLSAEVMRIFQARAKQVGTDIIGTRHFPEEMQGQFVIGGFYDNTLQIYQLEYRDGLYSSKQLPSIIETTNTVFRPIDVKFGPDGAIYVADWYNPIIGHYQASYRHPDRDKGHGRIWRITYKGRPLVKPPQLAGAPADELFTVLGSPERWVKYQAKRLLFEMDDFRVTTALDKWVQTLKPSDPQYEYLRLQALSIYEAHETVRPQLLKELLRSSDFRVRAYATRVLGNWREKVPDVLKLVGQQIADEHPRVRLEAVVASSYLADPQAVAVATRALDRPMDSYLDHALTKAVNATRPQWEPQLAQGTLKFDQDAHLLFVLRHEAITNAADIIHQHLDASGLSPESTRAYLAALAAVGSTNDLRFVFDRAREDVALLDALAEETRTRKLVPAGNVAEELEKLLNQTDAARQIRAVRLAGLWHVSKLSSRVETLAKEAGTAPALRKEAFAALPPLRGQAALPILAAAAESAQPAELALAALDATARVNLPKGAQLTVQHLTKVNSAKEAGEWLRPLLQRTGGADALAKELPDQSLTQDQAKRTLAALGMLGRGDQALVTRLNQLGGLTTQSLAYDTTVINELAEAARKTGDVAEGRKLFQTIGCVTCHMVNNEGGKIGPDLSALGRGLPIDGVIVEVLWPQVNVKEGFASTSVTTKDGRIIEGFRQAETADEISIRDMLTGEIARIRRDQVQLIRTGGSVMPEGLTSNLSRPQLASLIRYLSELGK